MEPKKALKATESLIKFYNRNHKYLENKYGLVDFGRYLLYFAELHNVYTTPLKSSCGYKEGIIKKYSENFICTKVYENNNLTTLVQIDKENHVIFDYLVTFKDPVAQEDYEVIIAPKFYSNNQVKLARDFYKDNKRLIHVAPEEEKSLGFGGLKGS